MKSIALLHKEAMENTYVAERNLNYWRQYSDVAGRGINTFEDLQRFMEGEIKEFIGDLNPEDFEESISIAITLGFLLIKLEGQVNTGCLSACLMQCLEVDDDIDPAGGHGLHSHE